MRQETKPRREMKRKGLEVLRASNHYLQFVKYTTIEKGRERNARKSSVKKRKGRRKAFLAARLCPDERGEEGGKGGNLLMTRPAKNASVEELKIYHSLSCASLSCERQRTKKRSKPKKRRGKKRGRGKMG